MGSDDVAKQRVTEAVALFGVTLQAKWGGSHGERALGTKPKHRLATDAAMATLLLHGLPHQVKQAKKAAKRDATPAKYQLAVLATDGKSLHLVMSRAPEKGEKKQEDGGGRDEDEEEGKVEPPPEEHAGIKWSGPAPKSNSVREQTILFSDGGVKENTVTRPPDELRDTAELMAKGESPPGLDDLLKRDAAAKVRGNRQLSKGNWDAVARPKEARAAEKKVIDRLNAVLAAAGTSVQMVESTLRDLASVSGIQEMRDAIVQRARAAPVLFFAYFHPVFRDNRRKYHLASKRHAEQLVGSFLETAMAPEAVDGGKDPPPLWRKTRVKLPAFSERTRSRQQHRACGKTPPKMAKDRQIKGDLVLIKGNWSGYGHNSGMQRAAGGFPRKALEKRVETSLRAQRTQQRRKTYIGVQDEYATSVSNSKAVYSLFERRANKFNPREKAEATIVKANGELRTFTVAKNRPHKLLAWHWRDPEGVMRLIVANRDEATCSNFLVIYVRAFLRKPRPLHLSRLGSFACFRPQTATSASTGRGLCGPESSLGCKPHPFHFHFFTHRT